MLHRWPLWALATGRGGRWERYTAGRSGRQLPAVLVGGDAAPLAAANPFTYQSKDRQYHHDTCYSEMRYAGPPVSTA
jgi:hypothetical protein